MQCTAIDCNALHHTTTHSTLQHTATRCSTLQLEYLVESLHGFMYTATHCIILQRTAPRYNSFNTTTHCNTLQHTATHCNAPQQEYLVESLHGFRVPPLPNELSGRKMYAKESKFICSTWPIIRCKATWFMLMCDTTHSYSRHDLFITHCLCDLPNIFIFFQFFSLSDLRHDSIKHTHESRRTWVSHGSFIRGLCDVLI